MFNRKKVCSSCEWERVYDSNRDTRSVDKYSYCPICGKKLDTVDYSPNI